MSNTYDIGVKFNIATSGCLNKKEKRKEINHNRKQFKIWVARQLDKFDEAENNMDYYAGNVMSTGFAPSLSIFSSDDSPSTLLLSHAVC